MANPFQQMARQRKLIYAGLILVLFTGSILHRRFVVEPQAHDLQLREMTRGEVELTGSAVRLLTTGSRGLATTWLWSTALRMQAKHEWNELELVVGSITTLQPYFITPWLFQSWNIAFNVAVECDRPHDKYYWVSRGVHLLAEGERRNRGSGNESLVADTSGPPRFPGHPELRHNIGFYYQLKIGNSDEKNAMRSLFDLSAIDPKDRDPRRLRTGSGRKRDIDLVKFADFCRTHPRLVRRLREQLLYTQPADIVKFLDDNRDVPSRYRPAGVAQVESPLEEPTRQFPVLPPPLGDRWPDAAKPDLGLEQANESFDVFLVSRAWYQYAQVPLPPPNPDPGVREIVYDPLRYRMPKAMASQIFRSYPSRAQSFIAENLEAEGWFEGEGWSVPSWFEPVRSRVGDVVIGTESRFRAGRAWAASHELYKDYGEKNGLYLSPAEIRELNQKAHLVRQKYGARENDRIDIRSVDRRGEIGASYEAHLKLYWNQHYRSMTNIDGQLAQAEAEKDPLTVHARRLLYEAEYQRRFEKAPYAALELYERAWPLWIQVMLKHSTFAQITTWQEDLYSLQLNYLKLAQEHHRHDFRAAVLAAGQLAGWPYGGPSRKIPDSAQWDQWCWFGPAEIERMTGMRNARGPLDSIEYYDAPGATDLREFLLTWTSAASSYHGTAFAPPVPFPGAQNILLSRRVPRNSPCPNEWRQLIFSATADSVRQQRGWLP